MKRKISTDAVGKRRLKLQRGTIAVGKRRLKLQRGTNGCGVGASARRSLKLHATLVRWLSVARSHLGAACGWIEGEEEEEGEGDEHGCGWKA